jgi:hypothetical protein
MINTKIINREQMRKTINIIAEVHNAEKNRTIMKKTIKIMMDK